MERPELIAALEAAAQAHHDFETVTLRGRREELWAGFYAAYVLGRVGDLMPASRLAAILEASEGDPWSEAAADRIMAEIE